MMLMPKPPETMPKEMTQSIAFGIAGSVVTGNRKQKHITLLYRSNNKHIMMLHLGWHKQLRHENWDGKYHWLELQGIDEEVQETFADWAVIVAGAALESPIPYSILFNPDTNFDSRGQFINKSDGSGLTCATFILALFSDFQLPLIDVASWPTSRKGDFPWIRKILNMLLDQVRRNKMPAINWLEQAKRRHELKRFRPEEVFSAASIFEGVPLSFALVESKATKISHLVPS